MKKYLNSKLSQDAKMRIRAKATSEFWNAARLVMLGLSGLSGGSTIFSWINNKEFSATHFIMWVTIVPIFLYASYRAGHYEQIVEELDSRPP